eukprot:CAMPEP_0183359642 /NCGR_PEP_ID=MMETSP0164_2-20130417/52883_1 /TAXON_ID=221442 /ORGANISM="Coccolithus pelagicus ssp braarudi, Strain PLY182g" /LENGTH=36 /DNA_ID= /DNA_START= /DNA_END= /DNA_ORIENTATION=
MKLILELVELVLVGGQAATLSSVTHARNQVDWTART